jgi:hypothetical protein
MGINIMLLTGCSTQINQPDYNKKCLVSKDAIRSRISKDRQYNGKRKGTSNDAQNTTQKFESVNKNPEKGM